MGHVSPGTLMRRRTAGLKGARLGAASGGAATVGPSGAIADSNPRQAAMGRLAFASAFGASAGSTVRLPMLID